MTRGERLAFMNGCVMGGIVGGSCGSDGLGRYLEFFASKWGVSMDEARVAFMADALSEVPPVEWDWSSPNPHAKGHA